MKPGSELGRREGRNRPRRRLPAGGRRGGMLVRRGASPMCQQEAVERRREPCTRRVEAVDEVLRQRGESGGEIIGGTLVCSFDGPAFIHFSFCMEH